MENQGFRLVEEKKQKKSFFALILSIFTVAGILFCMQQMFVDTKWWFISMVVSVLCCLVIFSTKSTKIVLVYFVLGILLLFAFRTIWISGALDGVGRLLGMSGVILTGFLFALPANELAIPVILMLLTQQSVLGDAQGAEAAALLAASGITAKTALCCLIFCVFHWPCSTTLLSIKRETGSFRWTLLAAAIPTMIGVLLCMLVNIIL